MSSEFLAPGRCGSPASFVRPHVLPQRGVDAALVALARSAKELDDIRVEAQGDLLLVRLGEQFGDSEQPGSELAGSGVCGLRNSQMRVGLDWHRKRLGVRFRRDGCAGMRAARISRKRVS